MEESRCNLQPCPRWVYSPWSKCSSACGEKTRLASCRVGSKVVDDGQCFFVTKEILSKRCLSECYVWVTSNWSACTASCGGGQLNRAVHCEQNGSKVSDLYCEALPKPKTTEKCNLQDCPKWTTGAWTQCSSSCNGGFQTR